MRTDTELDGAELEGAGDGGGTLAPRQLVVLRDRLHRGEHLLIAEEYLRDVLDYDAEDWRQGALVGLAVRHHLAELERDGRSSIGFESNQLGDGLSVTLKWPDAVAINEVALSVEFTDGEGRTTRINETFSRAEADGGRRARFRGSSLASEQAVVLRPLRNATAVSVTAEPGHRLRFKGSRLSPELRWSPAGEASRQERSIKFKPAPNAPRSKIDVYREKQGSEDILELTDLNLVLADIQRWEREIRIQRLKLAGRISLGLAAVFLVVMGTLLLLERVGVSLPSWVPFVNAEIQDVNALTMGSWERGFLLEACQDAVADSGNVSQVCSK